MILDAQHIFSDEQSVTATALSTNVYDLSVDRSIGNGTPMGVLFIVTTSADQGTGDEDYTIAIETASDAGITTARQELGRRIFESGTPTAPAQNADLLVAGFQFVIPIPPAVLSETERYLAVRYTVAGTTPILGISAYLTPLDQIDNRAYFASGYSMT